MSGCLAVYEDRHNRMTFRETDSDPGTGLIVDRYQCRREADHGGDHQGDLIEPRRPGVPELAYWRYEPSSEQIAALPQPRRSVHGPLLILIGLSLFGLGLLIQMLAHLVR